MYKNTLVSLIALTFATLTLPSHADGNWYAGGALSQTFIDEPGIDDDDTGGKIFGGYRFNDYFAIEGSFYDFGEMNEGGNQLELDGVGLAAVGSIPVSERFSLFGKLGVHAWDAEISGAIASRFSDDSDTDAFYGIGVEYALTDRWDIRGELERYEVDDVDLDVASIGISFNF